MVQRALLWGLLAAGVLSAVSWGVDEVHSQMALAAQQRTLDDVGRNLEIVFFLRHRQELAWLARQPLVQAAVTRAEPPGPGLKLLLDQTVGLLQVDVAYLVGADGTILASTEPGFVQADVSFRPYVQAALAGHLSFSFAVGQLTKTKGLYAAAPVWVDNRVRGLVAFRTNARKLDQFIDVSPNLFLLGTDGSVFSASATLVADPSAWTWHGPNEVRVGSSEFRVARHPLAVVPGYSLVSLQPKVWPWWPWAAANLVAVLTLVTVGLVRRQARLGREKQADERDQYHRTVLLANLLEGIAVVERSGAITWTNPAFQRLAQVEPDVPVTLAELWDKQGPRPWGDVLEGHRPWVVFEGFLRGRRGGWTPVLAGLTTAHDHFLLSVLDRTERYTSDQLLQHTQKLTVLGQLSGGIAHDLNNMLGVLTGMADLMKMTLPEQDPLQDSVDLMLTTLGRAAALAEKMLNFGRQTPIDRVPVDVNSLLRELRFLVRTALPPGIRALVEADEAPVFILGDENLLLSALLNLVINGAEAMDGEGRVTVLGRLEGASYTIEVIDEGSGMDKETLGRVFEPFFSTKGKNGTGLGLSLVRKTVLEHKGAIRVDSEVGFGTRITITLPVTASPVRELVPPLPGTA